MLFILVSLFLLLSSLYAAEASVFKKAREATLEAASPILSVFAGPVAFIEDRIGDVQDYFLVLEQNKALREQVASLRQWEEEARNLRSIVASYEAIGAYTAPPSVTPINAFVVGESNDAFVHTMIVNAGRRKGVAIGQAVIDDQGLVGRIINVSNNAGRVLLLNDSQSRVPVYVDGKFIDGILVGGSTDVPTIVFTRTDQLAAVEPGDKVYSSGAGGVLPRDIPVGEVTALRENGAQVRLSANYARTRMVRVINYIYPELDAASEESAAAAPATAPTEAVEPAPPVTAIPQEAPAPAPPGEDEE